MNSELRRNLMRLAAFAAAPLSLSSQVLLTGSSYLQDFNTLAGGLPEGWAVYTNATPVSLGAVASFTASATSWSSAAAGTSFRNLSGATIDPGGSSGLQAANSDRALGWRPLNAGTRDGGVVFTLANTIGWRDFALSVDLFTGNNVGSTNQSYDVEFRVGASGSFTLLGAYVTGTPFGATTFTTGSAALAALNDQPDPVFFRFHNADGITDSSYDTLGIDNFSLGYSAVPEPSTYAAVTGAAALVAARWRRRRRVSGPSAS